MKNTIKLFGIIALTALIGFTMVACPEPDDGGGNNTTPTSTDITWELGQEGGEFDESGVATATTTAIKITFSAAVDLTNDDITIGGVASRSENELKGLENNTVWTVPVTVSHTDNATVTIDKTGVKKETKNVLVYKEGEAPAITWEADVDGTSGSVTSTTITFTFSADVEELDAEDIELTNGTGSATATELTADESDSKIWKLGIEVTSPGTITVTINKAGITEAPQEVTVHKEGELPPVLITWSAVADGNTDTETTTSITFTFSADVEELELENIIITGGTGSIEGIDSEENWQISLNPGYEDNTEWTLSSITVLTQGSIKIKIVKEGIDDGEQTVAVYKAIPAVTYTVTADGTASADSTKITFTFSEAVPALSVGDISIDKRTGDAVPGTTLGSTNGGTIWDLEITAKRQGAIVVKINKEGVSSAGKNVVVYKTGAAAGNPVSDVITWLFGSYSGLQIVFNDDNTYELNGSSYYSDKWDQLSAEGSWTWDDTEETVTLTATKVEDTLNYSGELLDSDEWEAACQEYVEGYVDYMVEFYMNETDWETGEDITRTKDEAEAYFLEQEVWEGKPEYSTIQEYIEGETAKLVGDAFAPRSYTCVTSSDETLILLEALPESIGDEDELAGKTFTMEGLFGSEEFEFHTNDGTFSSTGISGSYSYDSDAKLVYLQPTKINDQTPEEFYDNAEVDSWSSYPTEADDRTVQTTHAFQLMVYSYNEEDKTLGGSGIDGFKAARNSVRQRSR